MRLIDADALVPDICDAEIEYGTKAVHYSANAIDLAPTIDAVSAVRCKRCRHAKWSEKNKAYYCQRRWAMHKVRERDFCSYGERKDGEQCP